ncbi:MAG: hypothetical protein WD018_03560 [Nitrosopumilaceae archaeon]
MTPGPKFVKIEELSLSDENLAKISSDPLTIFYNSLKSPFTKKSYDRYLKYFLCDALKDSLNGTYEKRAKQFADIAKNDTEKLNKILFGYVIALKKHTELSPSHPQYVSVKSLKTRIKPITKFCDMNDIVFNWKRLRSFFPENREDYPKMRGYTKEEIQKMLEYSRGPRDKAIILVAASSGIRTGAFDFCWGDIRPIYSVGERLVVCKKNEEVANGNLECASITVYKGSRDEYDAFITPEAFDALLEYKNLWKFETKTEPADSDFVMKQAGPTKKPLGRMAITRNTQKIRQRSGIESTLKSDKRRLEVPVMHGFRKFFNKTIKNTPSTSEFIGQYILKERMMGHASLVELDKNYYRENLLEKAKEYIKCVPYLTLLEDWELREKNRTLEKERDEMEKNLPKLVFEAVERMKQELMSEKGWLTKDNKSREKIES